MKSLTIVLLLIPFASAQQTSHVMDGEQNGGAAIVYSEGGAFIIDAPNGWTVDREVGKKHGVCCVYYPKGSSFENSETVMYPNIITKGPGQSTLDEFMASDLADFRDHSPNMTYENGADIHLKNRRVAKLRIFHNVNQGSSEAVAYIDEEKIIALFVVSSKTRKGLNSSIPTLRSILQSYGYMDVKFENGAQQDQKRSFQFPKD